MPVRKIIFLLLLLLGSRNLQAQSFQSVTRTIDSLAGIGLPKSALAELDKLNELARKNHDPAQQVRAAIYRMTFQSYLEENALTAIISTLRGDIKAATFPAKPVLQSILADMYWKHYQQNRYRFLQRTTLAKRDTDFTNWDLRTIIEEISKLYKASLSEPDLEQRTPVGVLNAVLAGDKATRYLRPTIYDLLANRAFDFYLNEEPNLPKPQMPFKLDDPALFSADRFARLSIKTTDTSSNYYQGILLLQQATLFHQKQPDEEAAADLALTRLRFLYQKSTLTNKDSLYFHALEELASRFATKPISADIRLTQAQYQQQKGDLVKAMEYLKRAKAAFPESLGGINAGRLMEDITRSELTATTEDKNMPGGPILALLSYANTKSAHVQIYRLSEQRFGELCNGYNSIGDVAAMDKAVSGLKPLQEQSLKLPGTEDYRRHSVEFKIDALPGGNYIIRVTDSTGQKNELTTFANFKVSRLNYVSRQLPDGKREIRVTDRKTGQPVKDVLVHIYPYGIGQTEGLTDAEGSFKYINMNNHLDVALTYGNDTLTDKGKYIGYYNTFNAGPATTRHTVIFTDRQIYRPGQTIYFNSLAFENESLTNTNKLLPRQNISLDFKDGNNKVIKNLQLTTNDFGTAAGTFTIPQNILRGNVQLFTENGSINIRVEEYKRPTFDVNFSPVKGTYKPGDSVVVKGNVKAFSGYGLSAARVAYHITRSLQRLRYYAYTGNGNNADEIKTDTIATNETGDFLIKFKAEPVSGVSDKINYNFIVSADVTDASGETHSANASVTVGKNNIVLKTYFSPHFIKKYLVNAGVSLSNLNRQPLNGRLHMQVFSLQSPKQLYRARLWAAPDQHLMDQQELSGNFPDYTFANEDKPAYYKILNKVADTDLTLSDTATNYIKTGFFKKLAPGSYKILLNATDAAGDTTSQTTYAKLIGETAKAVDFNDWVTPVLVTAKPGEHVEFMVGINEKCHVLVEVYNGEELLSSTWVAIAKDQTLISIPIPVKAGPGMGVQLMLTYRNRTYTSYQPVYVVQPTKALPLKLLTYHDKMQPGDKEQWKLQVNGLAGKEAAEMVAGLYDASLDDITPSQNWGIGYYNGRYYKPFFNWDDNNATVSVQTRPLKYVYHSYGITARNYEHLDMFGYNYYGGYNGAYQSYLLAIKNRERIAAANKQKDEQLARDYFKNAALVKNGYDISGRVTDAEHGIALPGVSVVIKGSSIGTVTNSGGYFKIKVPVNGVLIFNYVGSERREVSTTKADSLHIKLVVDEATLNEVVIVGYGTQSKREMTGAVSYQADTAEYQASNYQLRGNATVDELLKSMPGIEVGADGSLMMQGQSVTKARINGKDFTGGDVAQATQNLPADIVGRMSVGVLPGQYFSKEELIKGIKEIGNLAWPITLRTNFAETAFFYPQLRTDEQGQILIEFTVPDALTKWHFKAFAHTADLKTGYMETTVVTQKQLSISANTPRFLREGDTITISARLSNLTAGELTGKVALKLFNAMNMQQVKLLANAADAEQSFSLTGATNKAVSFKMIIPKGLDAVTYRLTADAGTFSDGEENTIPVLPNRLLVTESMPMLIRPGQTRAFTFDKLLNQHSTTLQNKTLTLEYTQNPAWYAVEALPYMMEYPYECSEQVFSRFYANSLATSLVNNMPAIKQVFDRWRAVDSPQLLSNLEKNPELKATLIEETPWLRDALNEDQQKKNIALLFDLNKMSNELDLNLDKLQKMQLAGGGWPWFGGDQPDRYISQHILEGIGQLYHLNIVATDTAQLRDIANKALAYVDNELVEEDRRLKKAVIPAGRSYLSQIDVHAWFVRSYFPSRPMDKELKEMFNNYMRDAVANCKLQGVYEQGMIALTLLRNGKADVARQIVRSLAETAQQSGDMGMYWGKNQLGYFWYQSPVETQCLMIELFTEAGNNLKAVEEMKLWLLRNKQTNNWKTTKATAAACYALLLKGNDWLADKGTSIIKLDNQPLELLKPDIKAEAGTGYIKTSWADEQIKPALGKVSITNQGKTISWGALHWQYLENLDKITPSNTDIRLERKYFIEKITANGAVLTAVGAMHQPKVGDLLKVVVYLKAGRDYEYVQLKDMRPSGTEPVDILSAYKYQDGLFYYQVTKDVATNFFISELAKGNYVFEYRLRVAQPGNFSTGISSVQSVYAPEFNAHSDGGRLAVGQ